MPPNDAHEAMPRSPSITPRHALGYALRHPYPPRAPIAPLRRSYPMNTCSKTHKHKLMPRPIDNRTRGGVLCSYRGINPH